MFDTCLIRRFAIAADVFAEVALRLRAGKPNGVFDGAGFRAARVEAERRVRLRAKTEEVQLEEIWSELRDMCGGLLKENQQEVELKVEAENFFAAQWVRPKLAKARQEGMRVIFVSDTYFPKNFVEENLYRHKLAERGDGIYVSSDVGKTKRTGSLFKHVLEAENVRPQEVLHMGDNELSDLKIPRGIGIQCPGARPSLLTAGEREALDLHGLEDMVGSRLAGGMRQFRLTEAQGTPPGTGALVGSFLGPTLLAFVAWVLGRARRDGVRRLYFLSRDCQMAWIVGKILAPRFGDIACRYLYSSRQALFLGTARGISPDGMPWLSRDFEKPALEALLAKLELNYEDVRPAWEPLAREKGGSYVLAGREDWRRFWDCLNEGKVRARLTETIRLRRAAAQAYFRREGLSDGTPSALVDLGWHLTSQWAINRLIASGEGKALGGYYLGLSPKRYSIAEAGGAEALFYDAGAGRPAGVEGPRVFQAVTLFEHILGVADHGCVRRYEFIGEEAAPVFHEANTGCEGGSLARALHAAAAKYASENEDLADKLKETCQARPVVDYFLGRFLNKPSREVAALVAKVRASIDQNNIGEEPLARPLTLTQTFSLCLPYRIRQAFGITAPRFHWPAGAVALTERKLRRLLWLKRVMAQAAGMDGTD